VADPVGRRVPVSQVCAWRLRLAVGIVALAAAPVSATYSVAAVDPATGEVGGAGASCVGSASVAQIYVGVPGRGVVMAQALLGGSYRLAEARAMLESEVAPEELLRRLTDPAFDPAAARRQYGVVDLRGRSAGYTGASTMSWAGDRRGARDGFVYAVQGNILTGEEVLVAMEDGFEGCDLAARLMSALEAGGAGGIGDRRCTPEGIPADGAFLRVDRSEGEWLRIEVDDVAPQSPVARVRARFDEWRRAHPCPSLPEDAAPDAGSDATASSGCSASGPASAGVFMFVLVIAVSRCPSRWRR